MGKKKKNTSKISFDDYYIEIYKEGWEKLKKLLLKESNPIIFPWKLKTPYFLDEASFKAASYLPINAGDKVLDMCAAPGGKTLVLAKMLNGTGQLISNDKSQNRRGRLKKVIEDCLPDNLKQNITITGHDSSKLGLFEKNEYDCILLDAPCSSERHVLQDAKALEQWSSSRPKRLAALQYSMLASAFTAVKIGGYILYSTCSINPSEDGDVVSKLFKKRPEQIEEITIDNFIGEKRLKGYLILPSDENNLGPLYYCLLRRIK